MNKIIIFKNLQNQKYTEIKDCEIIYKYLKV